jgi:hypothetical protein
LRARGIELIKYYALNNVIKPVTFVDTVFRHIITIIDNALR